MSGRRFVSGRPPGEFCGSSSGGGGFIKFEGEFKPLSWVRRWLRCKHCGAQISPVFSDVSCWGFNANAHYPKCCGGDQHLIVTEDDLIWKPDANPADAELKPGEVKTVMKAYAFLFVEQPDEGLPI